jgi:hypothetical protein
MAYSGRDPFPGLSKHQIDGIEAAFTSAPAYYHDGLMRDLYTLLGPAEAYSDQGIVAGVAVVMERNGCGAIIDPDRAFLWERIGGGSGLLADAEVVPA